MHAPATSEGRPGRPNGIAVESSRSRSGVMADATKSVSIREGQTALTRTPDAPNSLASVRVKLKTPPLEAA